MKTAASKPSSALRTDAARAPAARAALPVDLALQGSGSHGAFTWGVLDRWLQAPGLAIAGLSGTSAGAPNAAVLAAGWARAGADGARQALREFWLDVSTQGACFGHWPGQGSAGFSPIDLFVTATAVRSGQSAVTAAWTPT